MSAATTSSETPTPRTFMVAKCEKCNTFNYPVNVPGCRHCGAAPQHLRTELAQTPMRLKNFVTIFAQLIPELSVPAVIGEIEIAPGLTEEARLAVATEDELKTDTWLEPVWYSEDQSDTGYWTFRPVTTTSV